MHDWKTVFGFDRHVEASAIVGPSVTHLDFAARTLETGEVMAGRESPKVVCAHAVKCDVNVCVASVAMNCIDGLVVVSV